LRTKSYHRRPKIDSGAKKKKRGLQINSSWVLVDRCPSSRPSPRKNGEKEKRHLLQRLAGFDQLREGTDPETEASAEIK
jgi:hypothetical protein